MDQYRRGIGGQYHSNKGDPFGYFEIPIDGQIIRVMAAPGSYKYNLPWEHVSVSLKHRCPTWDEMAKVKDWFFMPEETVVQFHPKKSEYVNHMPYCLHLWRHIRVEHELPPAWAVGPRVSEAAK